jgi:hypothetical protein
MNTFKIFFLCEDEPSVTRAISLKETLAANCQNKGLIEADFFEYARLGHPFIRAGATQQAMDAEMIVVMARGIGAVPEFVLHWLNQLVGLCPEKIVVTEFLLESPPENDGIFHGFVDKRGLQSDAFLVSNPSPDGRAQSPEAGFVERNRLAESTFSPTPELFSC